MLASASSSCSEGQRRIGHCSRSPWSRAVWIGFARSRLRGKQVPSLPWGGSIAQSILCHSPSPFQTVVWTCLSWRIHPGLLRATREPFRDQSGPFSSAVWGLAIGYSWGHTQLCCWGWWHQDSNSAPHPHWPYPQPLVWACPSDACNTIFQGEGAGIRRKWVSRGEFSVFKETCLFCSAREALLGLSLLWSHC